MSGLTSVVVTYPLDLLRCVVAFQAALLSIEHDLTLQRSASLLHWPRTRMSVSTKYQGSIAQMLRQIVHQEGFRSLYQGASLAYIGIVPNLGT
jgi:hypothetical protein